MGGVETAKARLRNVRGALRQRPCRRPGHSERWDWEAHTGPVRRSAEYRGRRECGMRGYR